MMTNLTPKELFYLEKTLNNFIDKYMSSIKEGLKIIVNEAQKSGTENIKSYEILDKFDEVMHVKIIDAPNTYMVFLEDYILPYSKSNKIKIENEFKLIETISEKEFEKLGTYSLLPQSKLLNKVGASNVKKMSLNEKIKTIKEFLPVELLEYVKFSVSNYFSLRNKKVNEKERKEVLKKFGLYERLQKAYNLELGVTDTLLLKKEMETTINNARNLLLTDENKNNKEILEWYNYISKFKVETINEIVNPNEEMKSFLKFTPSTKKLKEFLKNHEINLEKAGITKEERINFYEILKPVSYEIDEFIKFRQSFAYGRKLDFDTYLKELNEKCVDNKEDVKKFIKRK